MKCLQCLTEVTSTRQNENERRTEAHTVVTAEGGGGPGLLVRARAERKG